MDEQERLERSRDSIDADPAAPGVQSGYADDGYADGYDRGTLDGRIEGAFWGVLAGAGAMVALSVLRGFAG